MKPQNNFYKISHQNRHFSFSHTVRKNFAEITFVIVSFYSKTPCPSVQFFDVAFIILLRQLSSQISLYFSQQTGCWGSHLTNANLFYLFIWNFGYSIKFSTVPLSENVYMCRYIYICMNTCFAVYTHTHTHI